MRTSSVVVVCVSLLLSSCSTLSQYKNECLAQDWQTMGYRDGMLGFDTMRMHQHATVCQKLGTVLDERAYLAGYQIGIDEFCQPHEALQLGEKVGVYPGSCPANLEKNYLKNYVIGLNTTLKKVVENEQHLQRKLKKLRNPRSGRYWFRKLTFTYKSNKEDLKNGIAASLQRQSQINELIKRWQRSDDKQPSG